MFALASAMPGLGVSWLAPQAPGNTWYPQSFLAPIEANQPHLSRALDTVDAVIAEWPPAGLDRSRIVLLGFSQGACLTAEYALRHPRGTAGWCFSPAARSGPTAPAGRGAGLRGHAGVRRHQ